jgi:hypothetical protein
MDNDYGDIIDYVKTQTSDQYKCITEQGKPLRSICNFGAKSGTIARNESNGEYHGLTIKFVSDVKPLLTDVLMMKILKLLDKGEYDAVINILQVRTIDEVLYVVMTWLDLNEISHQLVSEKTYCKLDSWIKSARHDPLLGRIKIIGVGFNSSTASSVVPTSWLDKVFCSAEDLHNEMDDLETRLGKPRVTFCCTYSMRIIDDTLLMVSCC